MSVLTRGNCSFDINQTVRFLNNPGSTHIVVVKRITRYFVGTGNLGLTCQKSANSQEANILDTSDDDDHAGADDHRSVSGWWLMLNDVMISWVSKWQSATAMRSTESEFYSVTPYAVEYIH